MRPLILISNDDGIQSAGIRVLAQIASGYGDVVVVAPNKGYSGQSHSITVGTSLCVTNYDMGISGVKSYMVSGSPVDCIKLGYHALVDRTPTLVLSGINHGNNISSSVHYSGTMGAVREGALLGVKGMGFSFDDNDASADLSHAIPIVDKLIAWLLSSNMPTDIFFSVNIPANIQPKGIRAVKMAMGHWREDYHMAEDPWNGKHYWLIGTYINDNPSDTETDEYWLRQGYATVCPIKLDVTATEAYNILQKEIF